MIVTRIAYSHHLTQSKFTQLAEIAQLCGKIRKQVWHEYAGISHLTRTPREIRDTDWMPTGRGTSTGLPARVWKATLEDTLNDIKATRAAAIKSCILDVYRLGFPINERKDKVSKLKSGTWINDPILHRLTRSTFIHGETNVDNQIVLDQQGYTCFIHKGFSWIAVTSLVKGKRIAIPLGKYSAPISGSIRLILRNGQVEIHHCVDAQDERTSRPIGDEILGLDKGYTETFTDQNGITYGDGLGTLLSKESDRKSLIYKGRNKVLAICRAHEAKENHTKADRIKKNNLGRKKLDRAKSIHTAVVRTHIHTSVQEVFDRASHVVVEDLSFTPKSKTKFSSGMNRKLSGWTKGLIKYALDSCTSRRGASVILVNAAYTSQWTSCCSSFGVRNGDSIYCTTCGVVYEADQNAASNILARASDEEIHLKTPYRQVRKILEGRAVLRLRLPNQDSSCITSSDVVSTESELSMCSLMST